MKMKTVYRIELLKCEGALQSNSYLIKHREYQLVVG